MTTHRASLSLPHRVRRPGPSPARGRGRPPLLLLLHGIAANELAMAALAPSFDPRFLVLSVRAPIEVAPFAFAWFHERPTPDGMVSDAAELARASAAIQSFVDEAAAAYAADADRTYLAGFSQGGALALATVVAAPDAIRGAVCMSGRLPREVLPAAANRDRRRGRPAVLILHGVGDETLRIEEARAARTTLQALDIPVEYRELEMGHTTTPESLAAASAWLAAQLDR